MVVTYEAFNKNNNLKYAMSRIKLRKTTGLTKLTEQKIFSKNIYTKFTKYQRKRCT